jgi:predicted outer membrane repeat protein
MTMKRSFFMMKPLSHLFRITVLAALLAATALSTKQITMVHADTVITVTTDVDNRDDLDGVCSLREAIDNANDNTQVVHDDCASGSGNDTIIFDFDSADDTIYLTASLPNITDRNGLTINGRRADGIIVTLHGQFQHRLFVVGNGGVLTLQSLNLFGGFDANQGGGIGNYGTLTVINGVFYYNESNNGGAIYSDGILTVTNSLFLGNFTYDRSADETGKGGAVFMTFGETVMNYFLHNTFSGNHATDGGDLYNENAWVWLQGNIFANSQGGGNCRTESTVLGNNNLIEDPATACGLTIEDDNLLDVDPLFADPVHGTLSSNSPAIDASSCYSDTSHNGLTRPQGTRCDIGAYEYPQTLTYARYSSNPAQDGWVLESSETSGIGGTRNNTATTLRIGDDAARKQYRAILSFDATSFPDDLTIASAELWLKPAGVTGKSPFLTHGQLLVDIRKGNFGSSPALQLADFKATASKQGVMFIPSTLNQDWYMQTLSDWALGYINVVSGLTQFRLRFAKDDDNDNKADFLKIVSGNGDPFLVPQLILYYYVRN